MQSVTGQRGTGKKFDAPLCLELVMHREIASPRILSRATRASHALAVRWIVGGKFGL
jgi:hypothetical protein